MTTFADLAPLDGRGLMWMVDVSTDNFATVAYRWATHSGVVDGEFYEARITELGEISRAFGADHLPAPATTQMVLDNTDFVADVLASRETFETTTLKARFKLKVGLTSEAANVYQAEVLTQTMGIFVCLDFPKRVDGTVTLNLADDSLGRFADMLVPPSFQDWINDAGTTASNAVFKAQGLVPHDEFQTPFPLQFGVPPYACRALGSSYETPLNTAFAPWSATAGEQRRNIFPVVVCATRNTDGVTADDAQWLDVQFAQQVGVRPEFGGVRMRIPPTYTSPAGGTVQVWKAYKSQIITLNGYDWRILWIAFSAFNYWGWWQANMPASPVPSITQTNTSVPVVAGYEGRSNVALGGVDISKDLAEAIFGAIETFWVNGGPGSEVTSKATLDLGNPTDIVRDLIEYYSVGGASAIDTTRFARAKLASRVKAKGYVSPASFGRMARSGDQQLTTDNITPYGIGLLRRVLAEIAGSCDLDIFVTMEGKVAVVAQGADFETQTTTYPAVDEERMKQISDKNPGAGERWALYNRVYLVTPRGQQIGPFDNPTSIATVGRVLTRVLPGKWWWDLYDAKSLQRLNYDHSLLWMMRNLESKSRPILSFITDTSVLALELGDYFTASWTRGGNNAVYASALLKLESVRAASNGELAVTAVWMGDLQSDQPYLLDNEDLVVRVAATFGRTLTVTIGSDVFVAASGSFITDGVAIGDLVRLRDATEAAAGFNRNRDFKITEIISATQLRVADPEGLTATVAVAEWKIVRGFATYPTAIGDPANYPSGSTMYGKVSNAAGNFSTGAAANKLLDG